MGDFLNAGRSIDRVAEIFARCAAVEFARLPLYRRLSEGVSGDPQMLRLAAHVRSRQPLPPLFLGAVQFLLMAAPAGPLAEFYPSLVPNPRLDADPYPAFRDFCLRHSDEIREIVTTRRVQTNEVARCATLLPLVARVSSRAPLAWIEAGASGGLNLNWPLYGYSFGDGRRVGDPASPVQITCEVKGMSPPLPDPFPEVKMRVGIDVHPVDLGDEEQARWLQALVWADQRERFARLKAAIELSRVHPVDVVQGDVFECLGGMVASVPSDLHVCVAHSYMMNQMKPDERQSLERLFDDLSRHRPISRLFLEWLDGGPHPFLELHEYEGGRRVSGGVLATCHWHAEWMAWTAP